MSTSTIRKTTAAEKNLTQYAFVQTSFTPSRAGEGHSTEANTRQLPIAEMTDLGNGYVIARLTSQEHWQSQAPAQPRAIPRPELDQVLKSYLAKLETNFAPATTPSSAAHTKRSKKDANQAFLEKMQQEQAEGRANMLANGTLLLSEQFQQQLALSRQAISKAMRENRLFALEGPNGKLLYPAFFADQKYDRRHLGKVSQALGDLPSGSKFQFFTTGKMSLAGKTPLEALAAGELAQVLLTARGFLER